MATAEYTPLAKTGGLADAVTGLAQALFERGHDVRVLLPHYGGATGATRSAGGAEAGRGTNGVQTCVEVPNRGRGPGLSTRFLEVRHGAPGPAVYLAATPDSDPALETDAALEIDTPLETDTAQGAAAAHPANASIYTGDERDAARFLRLSRAALELGPTLDWRPDVLHCHDWHTALVPALLAGAGRGGPMGGAALDRVGAAARDRVGGGTHDGAGAPRTVLTVHNLGYQGIFGENVLVENGAPELAPLRSERTRAQRTINFLELGIAFADSITTVSPTYAREIQRPEFGMGLDEALRARGADVVGILNGVDYRLWSPETDPYLDAHYTRGAPAPKGRIKRALEAELGLPPGDSAVIGCVTRLVWQKGIDVLAAALPRLLETTDARFALLGSGEPELERTLTDLAARHPARVAFRRGYDEALAHRILAGSDFVVVPSRYEPCGLTQLYALRYGTIPIVRATGGLADSVRHFDPGTGTGTGSVFEHSDTGGVLWGITTALAWYADAEAWRTLVDNAMSCDFSWAHQAPEYETLYERLVAAGKRP